MSLHRLFWVPRDVGAEGGAYVRGHPEELYAILSLEAHRRNAIVVGEDLGTVPPEVRASMRRHGLHRTYVVEMEARPESQVISAESSGIYSEPVVVSSPVFLPTISN